jgi:uncharacterized membrane protein YgdD (TMEM256/DUF423 family)
MNFTTLGALLGFLSVALGAFGAHALRARLDPEMLAVFETGVRYQFLHAITLLFVGQHAADAGRRGLRLAGTLFVIGIAVFSGSLYALALSGVRMWGAVTPLGGVCFLAGWLALAWAFRRR